MNIQKDGIGTATQREKAQAEEIERCVSTGLSRHEVPPLLRPHPLRALTSLILAIKEPISGLVMTLSEQRQ